MNKSLLIIHGTWLLVSISALAIGGKIFSTNSSDGKQIGRSAAEERPGLSAVPGKSQTGEPGEARAINDADAELVSTLVQISRGGDPNAYIDAFLGEGDPIKANKMFADLLLNITSDNAKEIFDALREGRQGRGGDFGREMGLYLEAWGRIDGASAVAAVGETGGDPRRRGWAAMSAVTGWASNDPAAAISYIASVEDEREKGMLNQGLIAGLARTDPTAATKYVFAMDTERRANTPEGESGPGQDRGRGGWETDRQMETIANAQLRIGNEAATTWAEGLPDGDLKSAAFDRVAENLARNDPASAAAWVAEHANEDYSSRAVREVAEEFGRTDPAAAIKWAEALPEERQADALRETLEEWTRSDPTAASTYLSEMQESPARDAAISSFARELDREDPGAAAQWAASIADERTRNETLSSVGRSWIRSAPDAAKAWLPTSGLSPEAQQAVLAEPDRGRDGRGR
ncbi:MAG: hypothetical protein ACI8XO_001948 [Verrucomicrobiales bacterium]|jgi:hypothetical protein